MMTIAVLTQRSSVVLVLTRHAFVSLDTEGWFVLSELLQLRRFPAVKRSSQSCGGCLPVCNSVMDGGGSATHTRAIVKRGGQPLASTPSTNMLRLSQGSY